MKWFFLLLLLLWNRQILNAQSYISGPETVCPSCPELYTVAHPVAGKQYLWKITGGEIYTTNKSDSIYAVFTDSAGACLWAWNEGNLKDTLKFCPRYPTYTINIKGKDTVCADNYYEFTASYPDSAEAYEWNIYPYSAGTIAEGRYGSRVKIFLYDTKVFRKAMLQVRIKKCNVWLRKALPLTISPGPVIKINMPDTVMAGQVMTTSILSKQPILSVSSLQWQTGDAVFESETPDVPLAFLPPGNRNDFVRVTIHDINGCINTAKASKHVFIRPGRVATTGRAYALHKSIHCAGNGQYDVRIRLTGDSITARSCITYRINSKKKTKANNFLWEPGRYHIVAYDGNRAVYKTTIALPAMPKADFDFAENVVSPAFIKPERSKGLYGKSVPIKLTTLTPDEEGLDYKWDFGNACTADTRTPVVSYRRLIAPYSIKLTVRNEYGCVDSVYKRAVVMDVPPDNVRPILLAEKRKEDGNFPLRIINPPGIVLPAAGNYFLMRGSDTVAQALRPYFEVKTPGCYWVTFKGAYGNRIISNAAIVGIPDTYDHHNESKSDTSSKNQ